MAFAHDEDFEDILAEFVCIYCSSPTTKLLETQCQHFVCMPCTQAIDIRQSDAECGCGQKLELLPLESSKSLLRIKEFRQLQIVRSNFRDADGNLMIEIPVGNFVLVPLAYDSQAYKLNPVGESPLHLAAKKNLQDQIPKLLKTVDINAKDHAGWTALHEAVFAGNTIVVKMLIDGGCLPNVPADISYATPLLIAISQSNIDIVGILLCAGADIHAIDSQCLSVMQWTDFGLRTYEYVKNYKGPREQLKYKFCYRKDVIIYSKKTLTLPPGVLTAKDKVCKTFDLKKITHIYMEKDEELSQQILLGLVAGKFFLNREYFESAEFRVPIPNYNYSNNEIINSAIQKATINEMLKKPRLFSGINVHIASFNKKFKGVRLNIKFLEQLITEGGGKILKRCPTPTSVTAESMNKPYHTVLGNFNKVCATYIIFDDENPPELQYHMPELLHKSSNWLLQCVLNFTIDP